QPFRSGPPPVTFSATSPSVITGTAMLTVAVVDVPPVVTTSGNVIVEATGPNGAVAMFAATATDIVDGADTTACTPASGSLFPLGTTTVTCMAIDANGLSGSAQLTVTVRDTTPPAVTTSGNVIVEATAPSGALATFTASATDAVDGTDPVTCAPASGSRFPLGATT